MATTSEVAAARAAPVGTTTTTTSGEKITSIGGGAVRIEGQPTSVDVVKQQQISETSAALAAGQPLPPGAALQNGKIVYGAFEVTEQGKTAVPAGVVRASTSVTSSRLTAGSASAGLSDHELMALGFSRSGSPGEAWAKGDYYVFNEKGFDPTTGTKTQTYYSNGKVYVVNEYGQNRAVSDAGDWMRSQGMSVKSFGLNEIEAKISSPDNRQPDFVQYAGKTTVTVAPEGATIRSPSGEVKHQVPGSGEQLDLNAAEKSLQAQGFDVRRTGSGVLFATRNESAKGYYEKDLPVTVTRSVMIARDWSPEEQYGRGINSQVQGIKNFTGIQAFEDAITLAGQKFEGAKYSTGSTYAAGGSTARIPENSISEAGMKGLTSIALLPGQLAIVPIFVKELVTNPVKTIQYTAEGGGRMVGETGAALVSKPVETVVFLGMSMAATGLVFKGLNLAGNKLANVLSPQNRVVTSPIEGVGQATSFESLPADSGIFEGKTIFRSDADILMRSTDDAHSIMAKAGSTSWTQNIEGSSQNFARSLSQGIVIQKIGKGVAINPYEATTLVWEEGPGAFGYWMKTATGKVVVGDIERVASVSIRANSPMNSMMQAKNAVAMGGAEDIYDVIGKVLDTNTPFIFKVSDIRAGGGIAETIYDTMKPKAPPLFGEGLPGAIVAGGGASTITETVSIQRLSSLLSSVGSSTAGVTELVNTMQATRNLAGAGVSTTTGGLLGLVTKTKTKSEETPAFVDQITTLDDTTALIITRGESRFSSPASRIDTALIDSTLTRDLTGQGTVLSTISAVTAGVTELTTTQTVQKTQTRVPPIPFDIIIPTIGGLPLPAPPDWGSVFDPERRKNRTQQVPKKRYLPSFAALALDITTDIPLKKLNKMTFTGAEIRPIPVGKMKKL